MREKTQWIEHGRNNLLTGVHGNGEGTDSATKQTSLSPQRLKARIWALKAMVQTYKGTEAEKMYLTMAENLEKSSKQ